MQELFDLAGEKIQEHWLKVLLIAVSTAIGWGLGKFRARRQWTKREFLNRLNISLNSIQNNQLLIRTLYEDMMSEVMLNTQAEANVVQAARGTTPDNPLLDFPKDDYWHYLNPVLNQISEQFSTGLIRRDLGHPVNVGVYLICLTCENAGEIRTRKVRAMVIQKELLQKIVEEPPEITHPNHRTRLETLQCLSREYQKSPWKFLEMEICV